MNECESGCLVPRRASELQGAMRRCDRRGVQNGGVTEGGKEGGGREGRKEGGREGGREAERESVCVRCVCVRERQVKRGSRGLVGNLKRIDKEA